MTERGYILDDYHRGFRDGWELAHEPAACGHARANWKDPKFGTPEYRGHERCEFCDAIKSAVKGSQMSVVTKPSTLSYDKERRTIITQPRQILWLREVDSGTDKACWVVCSKGDPGAWAFVPLRVGAEQPNLRGS